MPTIPSMIAVAGLVGGGISAYGQYKEGQEVKAAQSQNAAIAEQEAAITREGSILDEYRQRKALRQSVGTMQAGYAKSGVSVGTGSPLDAIADSIANAELEIQLGKFNAETEAKRKESEAANLRRYGKSAAQLGYIKAGSTLLTSLTDTGFKLGKEKIGS